MEKAIKNQELVPRLEALLFIYGEPMEIKKLVKILSAEGGSASGGKISLKEIQEGLSALEQELQREERGLTLVQDKGKVQLVTKPLFAKLLEDVTKQEFTESLTPAGLETLSIIAYAGPISRSDIEYIRGVNSSFIARALLMRGLIERNVDPKRSNTYLYRTSFELLRHLGLSKNSDLPDYLKYKELVLHMHEELQQKDSAQSIDLPPADATVLESPSTGSGQAEAAKPAAVETPVAENSAAENSPTESSASGNPPVEENINSPQVQNEQQ